MHTNLSVWYTYIRVYHAWEICIHTDAHKNKMHTCIHAYVHVYVQNMNYAYTHTYHTYIHTYIQIHIHTYISCLQQMVMGVASNTWPVTWARPKPSQGRYLVTWLSKGVSWLRRRLQNIATATATPSRPHLLVRCISSLYIHVCMYVCIYIYIFIGDVCRAKDSDNYYIYIYIYIYIYKEMFTEHCNVYIYIYIYEMFTEHRNSDGYSYTVTR